MNDVLKQALRNPNETLRHLDRIEAELSLIEFVKQGWQALEPGVEFQCGPAVETVAHHLEAVTDGYIRRLLINIPPGCTKSMLVNVFWPAWEWGPKGLSHYRYISAAYEQGLATRDMVRCRDLITSEWYQSRWPTQFKKDQDQKTYYENANTGWRFASSVGGRLVGYRGDRIIIDDPHDIERAESDTVRATARRWLSETVPTRLNKQKESAIVMIMQRLHVQDLSGLVIEKMSHWTHLVLPMEFERKNRCYTKVPNDNPPERMRRVKLPEETIPFYEPDPNGEEMYLQDLRTEEGELLWPERFDREDIDELKRSFRSGEGGSYAESGQLQQRPVHRTGGMFHRDNFQIADRMPEKARWVRGWDLAASKDAGAWTVGLKLGIHENHLYIADVVRLQGSSLEVEKAIQAAAARDGRGCAISIPQDPGQAGKAQKNRLIGLLHGYNVHFSPETGDKVDRAKPLASQVGGHNVFLPVNAPWLPEFLAEYGLFPASTYKDQVDAGSRAYAYLLANSGGGIALTPSKVF